MSSVRLCNYWFFRFSFYFLKLISSLRILMVLFKSLGTNICMFANCFCGAPILSSVVWAGNFCVTHWLIVDTTNSGVWERRFLLTITQDMLLSVRKLELGFCFLIMRIHILGASQSLLVNIPWWLKFITGKKWSIVCFPGLFLKYILGWEN